MDTIREMKFEEITLVLKKPEEILALRLGMELLKHWEAEHHIWDMFGGKKNIAKVSSDWIHNSTLQPGLSIIDELHETLRTIFPDDEMERWLIILIKQNS